MTLVEAFETGNVEGVIGRPDQIIETILSKLFFFGDRVFKVYKSEKNSITELDNLQRAEFYSQDFLWNNQMSPKIYLKLQPVAETERGFLNVSKEKADNFYILMKKIDNSRNLTSLLGKKSINSNELRKIIREMTIRVSFITKANKNEIDQVLNADWFKFNCKNIESLKWVYDAHPDLPKNKADKIIYFLNDFIRKEPYFSSTICPRPSASIDNQSDNIIFLDGQVHFINIYPPQKIWRARDDLFLVSRVATDAAVLVGRETAEILYDEYEKIAPPWPNQVTGVYEIESALIKTAYYFMIKKPELAKKYMNFIDLHPLYYKT